MLKISEIFYSVQGEGRYTGHPMIFIRLFGCNMQCKGFSNRDLLPVTIDVDTGLTELGCDSRYSWDPSLKATKIEVEPKDLVHEVLKYFSPEKRRQPIICFTGGEPLLQQKGIAAFINLLSSKLLSVKNPDLEKAKPTHILFETNASILVEDMLQLSLLRWIGDTPLNKVIWSNSPKLSNSGEPSYKAINPEVLSSQLLHLIPANDTVTTGIYLASSQVEMYLKYVSTGSPRSFMEIATVTSAYKKFLGKVVSESILDDVYVMAEGAIKEQQEETMLKVAEGCMSYGYIFCARVHTWLWGNQKGT